MSFDELLHEALAHVNPPERRYPLFEIFRDARHEIATEMLHEGGSRDDEAWLDRALLRLARAYPTEGTPQ